MGVSDQGVYSIGALARMLGVSPATLRSWEDRYGVVVPERSAGAQRLYSREHLDQLRFVCRQMHSGLSAADAHRVLAERLAGNPGFTIADRGEPAERTSARRARSVRSRAGRVLLAHRGLRRRRAYGCRSGATSSPSTSVDLAIVDLMIVAGPGCGCASSSAARLAVLAVSALDQHERALEAGAQAFMRKPLDPLALVSAVRDLIGTSAIVRPRDRVPQG